MACWPKFDPADVISCNDFFDFMPSFWHDLKPGCPNLNHLHCAHLKGPRLDQGRLRAALDALQARHPRLRAKLDYGADGKAYLLKDDTPIPLHLLERADHNCMNLDFERALMMSPDPHPGVFAMYIFYSSEHSVLLLGFRHGPGDGRAIEVALSHLLRLYDGREVAHASSHMNFTEIVEYDGTLAPEIMENWHTLDEEYPPVPRSAIHETFVQPRHPDFRARFEGNCIELLRFEAAKTKEIARLSRSAGTTITGAITAALQHAVLVELRARGLESDAVSIGILVNERQGLEKKYMQEMGNFASQVVIHSEVQPDFWTTAKRARRFLERVMELKCSWPAMVLQMGLSSRERLKLMQQMTPDLLIGMFEHGAQATISSLGVLQGYGPFKSFDVLENIQCSHVFFQGLSLNICTCAASGTMTLTIQVVKNVVPNARELCVAVKRHLEQMLNALPPVESTLEPSPLAAAFAASATAMEPLIARNREKLRVAYKTGDGTSAMMGDLSGAYNWKTHWQVLLVVVFGTLSSGPLSAFPLFDQALARSGVFSSVCDGVMQCEKQAAELRDLYATTFSMQLRFFILVGCAYDLLGAQKAAVLGGLVSAVCNVLLAIAVRLDPQAYPWTQSGLMYFGLLATDLGGNLASFGILAFMWHYPKAQALFIGLSNAASQASGGLGLIIGYVVSWGYPISAAFYALSFVSLLASLVFLTCCPSKTEWLTQAGRVLNSHPQSLDTASLISWLAVRVGLRECCRVFRLYPWENGLYLLYLSFFMAGELICFSSLDTKFLRWFDSEDASMLLQVYAVALVVLGIGLNPMAGFLFHCLGFLPVFILTSCLALAVPLTLVIPVVWVQLLHVIALVAWFALFLNVTAKYTVIFAPPDQFGTFVGFMTSVAGLLAYMANQLVQLHGFENLLLTSAVNMLIGWAASVALAVLLAYKGIPARPPKDGYGTRLN